jgi:hypothetical protein
MRFGWPKGCINQYSLNQNCHRTATVRQAQLAGDLRCNVSGQSHPHPTAEPSWCLPNGPVGCSPDHSLPWRMPRPSFGFSSLLLLVIIIILHDNAALPLFPTCRRLLVQVVFEKRPHPALAYCLPDESVRLRYSRPNRDSHHPENLISRYFFSCLLLPVTFVTSVSVRLKLNTFPWNFTWGPFMKIFRETPNLVKIGHSTWRPKFVLRLPATLNRHKSALFE